MFKKILVALENSQADQTLIPKVSELAKLCGASLLLLHVADGFAARYFDQLDLSESEEMKEDKHYLEQIAQQLQAQGVSVSTLLELGEPPKQIIKAAEEQKCDLIALTTHGHRLIGDIVFGSTIDQVRHASQIPLLIVREAAKA